MRRHLNILDFALSSLWRRKAKNLSILVVYAFTIAVLASILLVTHSLRREAGHLLDGVPELIVQSVSGGRHELIPTRHAATIAAIDGVGEVRPRVWGYYYDAITGGNYTLLGIGPALGALPLLEGRLPDTAGECALGRGVARALGADLGDDLFLIGSDNIGQAFEVVGIFRAESDLLTNDLALLREEDLRRLFAMPEDRATDIAVQVFNPLEVATVAAKVKRLLPGSRPITKGELLKTYDAVFSWRSGMMLTVFASALVAFCVLAWDKATGISAEERREIGILKAAGWDTSDVLELKFWEGLALSATAFLLGLTVAFVHVFVLGAPVLAAVMKGWSVVFPEFRLTPYLDIYKICIMAFLAVTPYVASTVVPSWKAAITDPEDAMRS